MQYLFQNASVPRVPTLYLVLICALCIINEQCFTKGLTLNRILLSHVLSILPLQS